MLLKFCEIVETTDFKFIAEICLYIQIYKKNWNPWNIKVHLVEKKS